MSVELALPRPMPRTESRPGATRTDNTVPPRARSRTRILIVDERGIMRDGLCALLAHTEEFEVVGSESSITDALRSTASIEAEVIVVDFPQTKPYGLEQITSIKARLPNARVLVLTFRKDDQLIDAALRAGADGYLLKNDSCTELFTALRSVAAGKGFMSPAIGERVAGGYGGTNESSRGRGSRADELTDRERQVIRLIAAGNRTREIAQILSLSHKTIEKHRTSLMRKLGLRNASAVAAYAIAHGLG